jgi:hypothetical protein
VKYGATLRLQHGTWHLLLYKNLEKCDPQLVKLMTADHQHSRRDISEYIAADVSIGAW